MGALEAVGFGISLAGEAPHLTAPDAQGGGKITVIRNGNHFTFPHVFSNDFLTNYMARAARRKGRARGSQSGDIWTREETMRESLNFDITSCLSRSMS